MKIETKAFDSGSAAATTSLAPSNQSFAGEMPRFARSKRVIDILFALLAIPCIAIVSALLLIANPFWNKGPVFFRQERMGLGRRSFTMWKFRTMRECGAGLRAADAPLDRHRVTPLGRFLRRTRLDELPNAINVLKGDMSLVGPRPDAFAHAADYVGRVPRYHERFGVKPGITGLAQVRGGYADNPRAVQRKARYDSFYVRNAGPRLELSIILSTIAVVLSGFFKFR